MVAGAWLATCEAGQKNLATRTGTLMKSWCSLTLASLTSCALGAAALQAVHAQAAHLASNGDF
jgi:hypothetical protein